MQTLEYRTVDKSLWGEGEWQQEPDKKQWQDKETGYPCLIVRGPHGALCGYVGIPSTHPLYKKGYSEIEQEQESINVHGGLTYSDVCQHTDNPSLGICHLTTAEEDKTWWLGFDAAHAGDYCPHYERFNLTEKYGTYMGVYRNVAYVTEQIEELAKQLYAIEQEHT